MQTNSRWRDQWVCIGGGTSGFGWTLAKEFALQGAKVAIVGRDQARGLQAAASLRQLAASEILFFSVDLADPQAIEASAWKVWLEQNSLAAAIAATGQSDRGYLMQLGAGDVDQLWRTNLLTSLALSQACVPALQRGAGTLVHIASLAGLLAAPGMGGYGLAKHAVVGMSRQLRLELREQGVRVLLVCPGPIQRDQDAAVGGRYDRLVEARHLPESLRRPAGGARLKALDGGWLSRRVLQAIVAREREVVVPAKARWLAGLGTLYPSLLDFFLKAKRSP
jgi:short-subunit dehydrogenase